MKRFLSLLMVLVLCVSLAPLSAFAEEKPEEILSGEDALAPVVDDDASDVVEPVEVEGVLAEGTPEETGPEETGEIPEDEIGEPEDVVSCDEISVPEEENENECVEEDLVSDAASDYERAIFPIGGDFHVTQLWYTGSHSNQIAMDFLPLTSSGGIDYDRWISAPFTGKIVATYASWGCVVFQSNNPVLYADGSVDIMTVVFGHDNYSETYSKNVTISQGQALCRAGTAGGYAYHTHIFVVRGTWSDWCNGGYSAAGQTYVNSGGGNVYPNKAFFLDKSFSDDWTQSSRSCYYPQNKIDWVDSTTTINSSPTAVSIDEGVYKICSSIDLSKCVEVANGSTATAANIQLGTYSGSNSQLFKIQKSGDYYKIINVNSGLNVDVANSDKASGANIQQCIETGWDAQLWTFEDAGDGYVYIHSSLGNYMDACGGVSTDGTNIQTYTLNKSNAQKFKLTRVADKVCGITYKNASGETWKSETPLLSGSQTLSAKYPTKSGSYFCGWSFTNGSTTIDARPGDTITVSSDITLYPVYVTHAEAISGKAVPIYNLSDFTNAGYTVTAADYKQKTSTTSGYWTDWSDWSTDAVSASDTVQVETTTLYGYYYFKCANCGTHSHGWGSGACYTWIGGCGSYISSDSWAVMYSTVNWNTTQDWHGTGKYYTTINGERWFKWTDGGTKTGYRYKTYVQTTDEKETTLSGCIITAKQTYTITYDANGGTDAPAAQTKTHDVALTLSSTKPTRTGYTFQGWAISKTATTASYKAGASYTNNAGVTLFAVWKQNAPTTEATITTANATAIPGGTVTVTVSIANNPGMMYLSVTPVYDKTVLTLESVKNGTVFPTEPTKDTNYTWDEDANVTGSGTLFTYTFKVKDSAAEGKYTVGISLRECYNASEQTVSLAVANGTVTVNKCVYGDATGEGTVNGLDLVRLRKYLAAYNYDTKTSTVTISAGADANGDGTVTGLDLVRLRRYLAAYNYDTKTSTVVLGQKG